MQLYQTKVKLKYIPFDILNADNNIQSDIYIASGGWITEFGAVMFTGNMSECEAFLNREGL